MLRLLCSTGCRWVPNPDPLLVFVTVPSGLSHLALMMLVNPSPLSTSAAHCPGLTSGASLLYLGESAGTCSHPTSFSASLRVTGLVTALGWLGWTPSCAR